MKAADRLRAAGFVNEHSLAKRALAEGVADPSVYVWYRPAEKWTSPGWMVERPGFKTDPGAHWQDRGTKRFDTGMNDPGPALEWASERYGVTEWATVPGFPRVYFPKPVADFAKRLVREATAGARPAPMKVYGWTEHRPDLPRQAGQYQVRMAVAAPSAAAAARIGGKAKPRQLFNFGESANEVELAAALAEPGRLLWAPLSGPRVYRPDPKQEWPT